MNKLPSLPCAFALAAIAGSTLCGQTVPPTDDQVVTLPSFTVSAAKPNQFRAVDSSSASRIRSSLMETPASISVLTPEFIQDIAPGRLYDATRYVAGISEGRGDGFADRQIIRGFENINRTVDNFSSIQGSNADTLLVDRVEVLKGPSAIIAPTGAPGGVVTIVSKAPLYDTQGSVTVTLGQIAAQRAEVDLTGAFSKDSPFAYRFLAAFQDGELASDGTYDERKIIGGSLSYRLSATTEFLLRGSFEERSVFVYLPVFISSASVNGADAVLAPGFQYGNNRNGTETWAHRGGEYGTIDARMTTVFGEHFSSRFAAKYQYNLQRDMFMAAVTPGLGNRYDPSTGQQTPDYTWALNTTTGTYVSTFSPLFDITNIQRRPFLPEGHSSLISAQYDLAANYDFSAFTSATVAGVAFDKADSFSRQLIGPNLPFNLLAPVYGAQPVFNSLASKASSEGENLQLYVNQQFGLFNKRLLLTAGFVRVNAESENLNRISNVRATLDDAKNLALFGALFKVTNDISIYASRSRNAVPTIANSLPLWQEGRQHEFGVKSTFLEKRLSVTLAHFQIAQTNVTVPNPAFQSDTTQPQTLVSDLKNRGYELEIVGGLTRQLSIVASASYLKEKDSLGRDVRAVAARSGGLFLNYKFAESAVKGLTLFGGVTHTGRRAGEAPAVNFTPLGKVTQQSFYLGAVTLLNLGARYEWQKFTFALNVDNALDKEYIMIPTARTNAGLGLPRNIRFTTTYRF